MPGPLSHLRVLDLSRVLAGPWASQVFADYGAEVIKIERPGSGDDTRSWGPPFLQDEHGEDTSESAYYLSANRGKHSVTVDITQAEGQALVTALAQQSDVLLENFKVGGLAKYGLDYTSIKKINPKIIYCSITGFGQDGPYCKRAGYDAMIQAMGGLMSVTGVPEGEAGAGPQKVGVAVADLMTGMYAVSAVLAALIHREQRGEGQHIDLALLDTQVAWLANQAMNYLVTGDDPVRHGTGHPNIVPYQAVPSKDGYFMLAVGNDEQFARFCALAGATELAQDKRFEKNAGRVQHRLQLIPQIEALTRTRDSIEWLDQLAKAGIPCGPINTLQQVFADEQVKYRHMQMALHHPLAGTVPQVANPVCFSATPLKYEQAPPTLGQHTREVLKNLLGKSDAEIDSLGDKGII